MRQRSCLLICAVALLVLPASAQTGQEQAPQTGVRAVLELSQDFYYVGDPLFVRVSIGNDGEAKVDNPVKGPLFGGFSVRRVGGDALERKAKLSELEPARPGKLARGSFYGAIVDLVRLFPELADRGSYEVRWSGGGVASGTLVVQVLPKFNPDNNYRAVIQTRLGEIAFELYPGESPIAVKAFVDMANAGFYDGLLFHEVQADRFVAAGDPRFGDQPRNPFIYPGERSSTPLVTGSVVMRPVSPSPPSNGSTFMVLLRPQPSWVGQTTLIGQVVRGMDVLQRISRLPNTGQSERPFFKPIEDLAMQSVRIEEILPEAETAPAGE
jgi:cyclophilin family peptidyl-prolyl cis-trans isomerase